MSIHFLKGCPLFYELYEEEIEYIISRAQVAVFEQDKFIVREGDEGSELFILLNGHADVVKVIDHQDVVLNKLEKGDVFGEMVIINETTRGADIVTTSKCEVLALQYDDIMRLYDSKPRIFAVLMFNLSRLLVKRIKDFSKSIVIKNTGLKDAG
jgi:CRP-like cAMP-binding protein